MLERFVFRLRHRLPFRTWARMWKFKLLGMRIGPSSVLGSVYSNWPHQVCIGQRTSVLDGAVFDFCDGTWRPGSAITIGDHCYVGRGVEFNCRKQITVGNDCLIAAGTRLIDHDHGMAIGQPMRVQDGLEAAIVIEDDVWVGVNVVILKGVTIGRGAVVAAGAIVNRSIPPYEIWGGVPARRLGSREGKR